MASKRDGQSGRCELIRFPLDPRGVLERSDLAGIRGLANVVVLYVQSARFWGVKFRIAWKLDGMFGDDGLGGGRGDASGKMYVVDGVRNCM